MAQRVATLPQQMQESWLAAQPLSVLEEIVRGEWWWTARPEQVPPPGNWLVALALAGRGWGKSRAGAEWLVEKVLQHPFDRNGQPTEWLLIGETLADTRTICMEGPAGLLRVLTRRGVEFRYKQSPRPMVLFPEGTRIYAEGADDEDVGRGYNAAGAWVDEICVARGSAVVTDRGVVPIESVTTQDYVTTLHGWRRVLSSGLTEQSANVLVLLTEDAAVTVTPNHRVWTEEHGWIRADQVQPGDTMVTCVSKMNQSPVKLRPSTTGMGNAGTSTVGWDTTSIATDPCSTAAFGPKSKDPSRPTTRSTTSTGNVGTTASATSNVSASPTIADSLPVVEPTLPGWLVDLIEQAGDCETCGRSENPEPWCAQNVAQHFSARACEQSTALLSAPAELAEESRLTRVVAVHKGCHPVPVYDLTVQGLPQFFANGLLVHNCKWPKSYESWYEGILPSLRTDLIGDHPRCFATTTPKPIRLLQEWVKRDDGTIHIMGGSTFDNSVNLSAHVLRELKTRYGNSDLGQQELYGKLLELGAGGLFKRMDIVNGRVDYVPDDIVSTVVGVDPNLTGEDDLFGIIVVARTVNNDLYVLEDASVEQSGRTAALAAWRAMAKWNADTLVYEENLGKRYLAEVLQDAYKESISLELFPEHSTPSLFPVHAKHGKRTRAEPVAMRCEQKRLHMVGEFEALENEMCLFDPESTRESPDRMDAMVHAALHLMRGERRIMKIAEPSAQEWSLSQDSYDLSRLQPQW
jgi:phage terminase large subunit-like protein